MSRLRGTKTPRSSARRFVEVSISPTPAGPTPDQIARERGRLDPPPSTKARASVIAGLLREKPSAARGRSALADAPSAPSEIPSFYHVNQ